MVQILPNVAKDKTPSYFGRRLKELREAAGLTQAELADAALVTKLTILRLENGGVRAPDWGVAERLAEVLDVPLDEFRESRPERGDDEGDE